MKIKRYFAAVLCCGLLTACRSTAKEPETEAVTEMTTEAATAETAPENATSGDSIFAGKTGDREEATPTDADMTRDVFLNQVGHRTEDQKLVIVRSAVETDFSVVNATTKTSIFDGELMSLSEDSLVEGDYKVGSFTEVTIPGKYYISCGAGDTGEFTIGDDIYKRIYLEILKDIDTNRESPDETTDMNEYLINEAKIVSDLLFVYSYYGNDSDDLGLEVSGNNIPDLIDEAIWHVDKLLQMGETELTVEAGKTERALLSYVAGLARASYVMNTVAESMDEEAKEERENLLKYSEEAKERAVNVWNSIPEADEEEDTHSDTDSEEPYSRDVRYYAAAALYLIDELPESDVAAFDVADFSGGFSRDDMSGYAMYSLDIISGSSGVAASARERFKEIVEDRTDAAEEGFLSPALYGDSDVVEAAKVCDTGMFFIIAQNYSDDERVPVIAKRQLDYFLGENTQGICYLSGYGYNSIDEAQENTRTAALLFMLSDYLPE